MSVVDSIIFYIDRVHGFILNYSVLIRCRKFESGCGEGGFSNKTWT